MKLNMGNIDRIVRLVVAIILISLAFNGTFAGILGVAAWIVAAIFVFTALVGFCPLYRVIGVNTCPKK